MKSQERLFVQDSSQIAEARRTAVGMAREMGYGEAESGKIALVVTEAATNLLKHAGGGELLIGEGGGGALEILVLDKGPGIADVERSLEDGYSTGGSPGTGLGAMRRLSSQWEIHTKLAKGTAILCRFVHGNGRGVLHQPGVPFLEISGTSVAIKGEPVCGDGWAAHQNGNQAIVMVADGLGHGQLAADAAMKAVEIFEKYASLAPAELLGRIHAALRTTRGAAVALAKIDGERRTVTFAGVGNIAGAVMLPGGSRQMVCLPGIVGHETRTVREFEYPWPAHAPVALASDGLVTQWPLRPYDDLFEKDPALIAGVLYRDHHRGHDDATVVIASEPRGQG